LKSNRSKLTILVLSVAYILTLVKYFATIAAQYCNPGGMAMSTFGWIVIAMVFVVIVISAWRLNNRKELCRRIESKLAGTGAKLGHWTLGPADPYPVIIIGCNPKFAG